MPQIQMPVGDDIFETVRKDGSYYVDKTELITDLVSTKRNKVTLFTRPRRFGKTLNMSMLDCFFDITRDSKNLFEGLYISEQKELCENWMNKYPTMFISFKEMSGNTFEYAFSMLKNILSDLCIKFKDIINGKTIDEEDKQFFLRLKSKEASLDEVGTSLLKFSRILYEYYNKPVIILIDEYDVPISYANENGYYKEMIDIMRSMFLAAFKTNPYLKFAVITGCLRIAKESIFTGTNNFVSYSILDNEFSKYFGFTNDEVRNLLDDCELSDKAEKIKEWYDGYLFGNTEMYCPWDVINYVSALQSDPHAKPQNYWRNTSHNGIIRSFVDHAEFYVNDKFERLMSGEYIEQEIEDTLTYNEIYDSEDNLWSMLYMTGYVTKADNIVSDKDYDNTLRLRIPNKEILIIFQDTVVKWFKDNIDKSDQNDMMNAFWEGDTEIATKIMSDLLWQTISYNDYREDYYHAFMAGIFTGMGYAVDSNKESGLGRPDIMIKDRKNRRALIIETKRANSEEEMEEKCSEAIKQIENKAYDKGIPRGFQKIMCYGVAFYEKSCLVKLK